MKKPILEQTNEELMQNIANKNTKRRQTLWKKPKRMTVANLAKSWGLKKDDLIKKILDSE